MPRNESSLDYSEMSDRPSEVIKVFLAERKRGNGKETNPGTIRNPSTLSVTSHKLFQVLHPFLTMDLRFSH